MLSLNKTLYGSIFPHHASFSYLCLLYCLSNLERTTDDMPPKNSKVATRECQELA